MNRAGWLWIAAGVVMGVLLLVFIDDVADPSGRLRVEERQRRLQQAAKLEQRLAKTRAAAVTRVVDDVGSAADE